MLIKGILDCGYHNWESILEEVFTDDNESKDWKDIFKKISINNVNLMENQLESAKKLIHLKYLKILFILIN